MVNSRTMLARLVKQKLLTLKPLSDKLVDLVLLARAKQSNAGYFGRAAVAHQPKLGYVQKITSNIAFDGDF